MVKIMENPIKMNDYEQMDDLGVNPLFSEILTLHLSPLTIPTSHTVFELAMMLAN